MYDRDQVMVWRLMLALAVWLGPFAALAADIVQIGKTGLHIQEWFYESELNLGTDLREAETQGKDQMVLVGQRGCAYCAMLHAKNLSRTEIVVFLGQRFLVVQLDLNGSRTATGLYRVQMSEVDLLQKWGVGFTPTTMVFAGENAVAKTMQNAETFRLPGYLEPMQYYLALDYFASEIYETQDFGEFTNARVTEMIEAGIDPRG